MSSLALCSTKNFNSWLWHLVLYFTFVFAFVFGSAGCPSLPRSTKPPRTSIAYLGASRPKSFSSWTTPSQANTVLGRTHYYYKSRLCMDIGSTFRILIPLHRTTTNRACAWILEVHSEYSYLFTGLLQANTVLGRTLLLLQIAPVHGYWKYIQNTHTSSQDYSKQTLCLEEPYYYYKSRLCMDIGSTFRLLIPLHRTNPADHHHRACQDSTFPRAPARSPPSTLHCSSRLGSSS
jgi:hypothetical protein